VDQATASDWRGNAGTKTDDETPRNLGRFAGRSSGSMIYLDSSVALAYLLAEDRYPSNALWDQSVVSSRLLECEVWNRIDARRIQDSQRRCRPRPDRSRRIGNAPGR
jgi:hypothetical protein